MSEHRATLEKIAPTIEEAIAIGLVELGLKLRSHFRGLPNMMVCFHLKRVAMKIYLQMIIEKLSNI